MMLISKVVNNVTHSGNHMPHGHCGGLPRELFVQQIFEKLRAAACLLQLQEKLSPSLLSEKRPHGLPFPLSFSPSLLGDKKNLRSPRQPYTS